MVDSRAKGRTAETKCKEELNKLTNERWERVPMSGALDPKHGLKGDLYIPPNNSSIYCVEVKHYKEDHLTSKILTSKTSKLEEWWNQTIRESNQIGKEPLLIFKFDRSKWFAAYYSEESYKSYKYITVNHLGIDICLLPDYCKNRDFT